VTRSQDARLGNLLGAAVLGLGDAMRHATELAASEVAAGPAALVFLAGLGAGRSIDDLRQSVGLTPSGGVRLVDRLVADGFVVRRPGRDARSLSLVLTPAGRRVARRVRDARARVLEDALAGLGQAERDALTPVLEQLITTLVESRLTMRDAGEDPPGGWLCRLCDAGACGRDDGECPAANTATRSLG
jgi:DNA-binding MarR family transcriptional regulator